MSQPFKHLRKRERTRPCGNDFTQLLLVRSSIVLDPQKFGTHSLRRTKAILIYRRTGNLI